MGVVLRPLSGDGPSSFALFSPSSRSRGGCAAASGGGSATDSWGGNGGGCNTALYELGGGKERLLNIELVVFAIVFPLVIVSGVGVFLDASCSFPRGASVVAACPRDAGGNVI